MPSSFRLGAYRSETLVVGGTITIRSIAKMGGAPIPV
jgi:hypothetical protein